jgi:lipopolysaccharide transport system ATP-binding protein
MSDRAIIVEGLSKSYLINRAGRERYTALRDVLARKTKQLLKKMVRPFPPSKAAGVGGREEFWALRDISFEVRQGERIGIIGRNGAGKSTLLKILSRITAPTRGSIKIHGRVGSLLEVGTGFHPELSGRENIFLNGAIIGMRNAEIRKKFDEIVAFAEVEKFLDTPVKHYSSGMYVRLAFAVAAHLEPEILIVDEVLAVGDSQFQKKCLGKMGDVSKNQGRTVLFVSHNMTAIKSLCNSALLLEKGMIRKIGEVSGVVNDYLATTAAIHEQLWELPETAPGNDMVRFHKAKIIIDDDKSAGQIRVDTPLRLEFEFWNYVDNAELNLSMHVYNNDNLLIFASPSPAKKFAKGLIKGVCMIPPNLLNDEKYSIMQMIVIDQSRTIFQINDLLSFDVSEVSRESGWMGKFPGLLRPQLEWHVEAV